MPAPPHLCLAGRLHSSDATWISMLSSGLAVTRLPPAADRNGPARNRELQADLLVVAVSGSAEVIRIAAWKRARPDLKFIVLDRGARSRNLADAFRLGALDSLAAELDPALKAERIAHLCRRISAERSLPGPERVR